MSIVAGEAPRDLPTFPDADLAILALPLLRSQLAQDKSFSKQVTYIAPLIHQELHILARSDVRELADLNGRSVNFGPEGGIAQTIARRVLTAVRVRVEEVNLDQAGAVNGLRAGEIAASFLVAGVPNAFVRQTARDTGLHLLNVPLPVLDPDYKRIELDHSHYPELIAEGETIPTLAVNTILVAYNWPLRSRRWDLLATFARAFLSRVPELQDGRHHPKWAEVDVASRIDELVRFSPAESWLRVQTRPAADETFMESFRQFMARHRKSTGRDVPTDQMYQEFLRWRATRGAQ